MMVAEEPVMPDATTAATQARRTYPDGTLLALAMERAHDYWMRAAAPTTDEGADTAAAG